MSSSNPCISTLSKDLLLYAVTDARWLKEGQKLAHQVAHAIEGGVTCVQLREKHASLDILSETACEVRNVCHRAHVPYIINDYIELVEPTSADGLHVGQSDIPAKAVKQQIGHDKILGVSASTVEEALQAYQDGAHYLGVGSVFTTSTKDDANEVSLSLLSEICACVPIPVVAIGGITLENVDRLKGTGIAGVAVVSALFAAADIKAEAQKFRDRLEDVIA